MSRHDMFTGSADHHMEATPASRHTDKAESVGYAGWIALALIAIAIASTVYQAVSMLIGG